MELTRAQHAVLEELAARHGLDLVVLFGSRAKGRATAESDTDIAVRAAHELSLSECLDLAVAFDHLFPECEVVDLRAASPLLLGAIARDGIPLYEERPDLFVRFRIMATNIFWDFKPTIDRWARYTREKIRKYEGYS